MYTCSFVGIDFNAEDNVIKISLVLQDKQEVVHKDRLCSLEQIYLV